jgi:hypothetical protein
MFFPFFVFFLILYIYPNSYALATIFAILAYIINNTIIKNCDCDETKN